MISEYSKVGSYHSTQGLPNQDSVSSASNERYKAIVLADGVSTCPKAQTGAEIVSGTTALYLQKKAQILFDLNERAISARILDQVLELLEQQANKDAANVKDYSCTLSAALLDTQKQKLLCFNLGDGLILGSDGKQCYIYAHPASSSEGCSTVTTEFAAQEAETKVFDCSGMKQVYILSDGAWRLMTERNRLNPTIQTFLINGNIEKLKDYLDHASNVDDSSFISMKLQ